jgi:HK97 family phage prohead protease
MNQQMERRQIALSPEVPVAIELREDSGLSKIVGYSAVFGVDTEIQTFFGSFKERIQKGAFRRAIREGQDVRALRNHDPDNLLGRTTAKTLRLKEDDTGLWIEVDPPSTTVGTDTVESIRRGDLSGMSFAFIVRKEKWVNGEDGSPDVRIIQDVDLFDVGPVTYPAYAQTSADVRSASAVYQVGLAELGRNVPRLPDPTKRQQASQESSDETDPDKVAAKETPEAGEAAVEAPEAEAPALADEAPEATEPPAETPELEAEQKSKALKLSARLRKVQAEKKTNELRTRIL